MVWVMFAAAAKLDADSLAKYGADPAFQQWAQGTPSLLPWPL